MKIINLMENTQGNKDCLFEHGLSFYIETQNHTVLVDCGQSDAFIQNAKVLGVDLREVDTVILSHGHYDHSGGILPFAKTNSQAPIYMQKTAILPYYHKSEQEERYIGIDSEIIKLRKPDSESGALWTKERNSRIQFVEGDLQLDEELTLFSGVKGRVLWPKGNLELAKKTEEGFVQDTFDHEQYLVVTQGDKKVLFSGCAHNGILNILEHFREEYGSYPDAVFSGFHMKKKEYTSEDDALIKETAKQLMKMPTKFYTGHCTGEYAFALMKEIMGDQLTYTHSGDEVLLTGTLK